MILHVFLAETKFIILHVLYIVSSRATAYLVLQRSVYQKYPVSLGFFFSLLFGDQALYLL